MDKTLELIRIPLSQIKPDPKNAKDHDIGLIIESFRRFGYVAAMVVSDDTLLAGHGRRKALLTMKADGESPPINVEAEGDEWMVLVEDVARKFSKRDAAAYRLVDNRSTEVGGYDEPQLLENLIALSKNGGIEATGYDDDDVDRLFALLNPPQEIEVEDSAKKLQKKWGTKRDQLWGLGSHRLFCGDSTKKFDMAKLLNEGSANLIVTSPPYWLGMEYEKQTEEVDVREFIQKTTKAFCSVMDQDKSRIVINTSMGRPSVIQASKASEMWILLDWWQQALKTEGWNMRHVRIWAKHGGLRATSPLMDAIDQHWEFIATFYCPNGKKRGQNRIKTTWSQQGYWADLHGEATQAGHIASFPVEIPSRLIQLYGCRDEIILDPFLGAGTTMVAAEQLNRICYGMEIEPKYVAVTLERMSTMGLEPKLLS